MSNLVIVRTFEIVSVFLFIWLIIWGIKSRNPLWMGAIIGTFTAYGFDWAWCGRGFFNATFNDALIPMPWLNIQGITEPLCVPMNYAFIGWVVILLVKSKDYFDSKFGVWGYLVVWFLGILGIAVYEIPVVHVLHIWTYHQSPEFVVYGFPWSNFWLAGNLVGFSYSGLRWAERWADLPDRPGLSLKMETTWKGLLMGIGAVWSGFYFTYIIQLFWYSSVTPWIEVGRPW